MKIFSKVLAASFVVGGLTVRTVGVVYGHIEAQAAIQQARGLDHDDFPHMRHAIEDLRHARESLATAEDRFRGHREKALDHVDAAIAECEKGMEEAR